MLEPSNPPEASSPQDKWRASGLRLIAYGVRVQRDALSGGLPIQPRPPDWMYGLYVAGCASKSSPRPARSPAIPEYSFPVSGRAGNAWKRSIPLKSRLYTYNAAHEGAEPRSPARPANRASEDPFMQLSECGRSPAIHRFQCIARLPMTPTTCEIPVGTPPVPILRALLTAPSQRLLSTKQLIC
jgi:hypothetical protein